MPRIGFGRWLLSWITKPLVAARATFERILGIAKGAAPEVTQSQVAGAYRAAEKALDLMPSIQSMDRASPWEIGLMAEDKLGKPHRYMVTFRVQVYYPESKKTEEELRRMYFDKRMSASEYEQAYLGTRMGSITTGTDSIVGAEAVEIEHYAGLPY